MPAIQGRSSEYCPAMRSVGDTSCDKLLSGIPMGRAADKDEIADLAIFLVSGAADCINGT